MEEEGTNPGWTKMFIVQNGVHESQVSQTEHSLKFSREWFYLMRYYPVLRAEEIVNVMLLYSRVTLSGWQRQKPVKAAGGVELQSNR